MYTIMGPLLVQDSYEHRGDYARRVLGGFVGHWGVKRGFLD